LPLDPIIPFITMRMEFKVYQSPVKRKGKQRGAS
jgi:hypothetical protein